MSKYLFFALFLYSLSAWAQSTTLTWRDCLLQVEQHSPQAELLPLIKQAADLQVALLQKNNLPQATASAQATWQSAVTSLPSELPVGLGIESPSRWQYKANIDINQNIWDGGSTRQQQALVRANATAEVEKLKTDLYSLREQANALFFGVLLAEKQIGNAQLLQKDLMAKKRKAEQLRSGGLATGSQIWVIDARLLELEQQIAETQNRKDAALQTLAWLTGNPAVQQATLLPETAAPPANTTPIARPELAYFKAQRDAIDASEKLIKAKSSPKIGAFVSGGLGRPALNMLSNSIEPYAIGGLQLRVPLGYLYSKSSHIERQQIAVNKAKNTQMEAQWTWLLQSKAIAQRADIDRYTQLLHQDQALIELREKIRQTAEVQLENGIITPADYLTEANNADLARQNLIIHELQHAQAIAALRLTLGY